MATTKEGSVVQVNVNLNGLNAIAKVGIAQPLFDWLKSAGVKVKLTATEFRLILGDTVQSVPVTLDQIHALNAGNLSVAAKSLLRNDLTAAITTLTDGRIRLSASTTSWLML